MALLAASSSAAAAARTLLTDVRAELGARVPARAAAAMRSESAAGDGADLSAPEPDT